MGSGPQDGDKNWENFSAWEASKTDEEFRQMVYRGQLHRSEMAKEAQIGKSALRQNPRISQRLEQLENELRERGVLPPKVDGVSESKPKVIKDDPEAKQRSLDSKRVQELEAENLMLRARLRRYEELSETLHELGVKL